ncbi:GAF domain-containing SpoIIE family protein phosphatase [Luteimicrobium sp. DT211]|uniref:GAF domain-containing SpoIIE family protein phosphatase n=1 Tax=Luteimicrobium sp. DT211 TaxID=3393412 RepID=UPI003CF80026
MTHTPGRLAPPATRPGASAPVTPPDPAYERFARLLSVHLDVPVALVSLRRDDGHVGFPGAVGLTGEYARTRVLAIEDSFCRQVLATGDPLVLPDVRATEQLDSPALRELDVAAYAGYPVLDTSGATVGTLCAITHEPRAWTQAELTVLADLAEACATQVRLREESARARSAELAATRRHRNARTLLHVAEALSATTTVDEVLAVARGLVVERVGATRGAVALADARGKILHWAEHGEIPGLGEAIWSDDLFTDQHWPSVQVLRTREALWFETNDDVLERFPRMPAEGGPGALALLPMLTRDAVLGVIVLRWADRRMFDHAFRDLLSTIAGYTAVALERARLLQHRRDVAHVLQTALLTDLPAPDGVTLDGAYVPAVLGDQVGGDWYDALVLPSGDVAVTIGDVTGHDIDAAALMGQLRSLLRGFLWRDDRTPAQTLAQLDAANVGTGVHATASVLLARLGAAGTDGARTLTWSSAGHPPAFVVRASGAVQRLDGARDLILGVAPGAARHDHTAELRPGDTAVLYTDGLVERRGEDLHHGLDRLAAVLAGGGPGAGGTGAPVTPAGDGTPRVAPVQVVRTLVPGDLHDDDIAVLTLRVDPV